MSSPKVGLALSGGGARGLVHIGILKALLHAGIQIDCISGTSMGGVIAAAYACGLPVEAIEEKALKLAKMREFLKLVDPSPTRRGLLEGNRVRNFLTDIFLDRTFDSLTIPLALTAVDLDQSSEVIFTSGLVFPAVIATMSVPGLFKPMEYGKHRLVDGGLLNNLPVDQARALGADIVIAVDALSDRLEGESKKAKQSTASFHVPLPGFFQDFYRAEMIMIAEITQARLQKCKPDILLNPPLPGDVTLILGFNRAKEIIDIGEACANENIPAINQQIADFERLMMNTFSHEQEIQSKNHQTD